MLLNELIQQEDIPPIEITGVTCDSRKVVDGDLYIAYQGTQFDGHDFVQQAIECGACAILAEHPVAVSPPTALVVNPDAAMMRSRIAARYYGNPSRSLSCIGITGTNGKTSIAYGLASLLESTAFAGSLGWGVLPSLCETGLTTIDPIGVQAGLAYLRTRGVTRVAMEVSSHALDQGRVENVDFELAVFTNLTRDHLDYHGSMNEYAAAKARLFRRPELRKAVVNIDDAFGETILKDLEECNVETITYGKSAAADVRWTDEQYTTEGVTGTWLTPWGKQQFELPVYGRPYLENAAAVLICLQHYGYGLEDCELNMRSLRTPPGRMEFFRQQNQPTVVIDYAHTPDALQNVLKALRAHFEHSPTCVFGCGGDRDTGKRRLMGRAVDRYASRAIVTSDNPRSESPTNIAQEILTGFSLQQSVDVILDRREAITRAIETANTDDVVLIAGKGDERTQEIQGLRVPFSDRQTVLSVLKGSR